ncbi:MAG: hypothetical protein ACM3OF_04570, partial [Gemmatimonas sp.]
FGSRGLIMERSSVADPACRNPNAASRAAFQAKVARCGREKMWQREIARSRERDWRPPVGRQSEAEDAMKISDFMTPDVQLCTPEDTVRDAAEAMAN